MARGKLSPNFAFAKGGATKEMKSKARWDQPWLEMRFKLTQYG